MENVLEHFKRLNRRAERIVSVGQQFWEIPKSASPLLVEFHMEFSFHWAACSSSLVESISRNLRWYLEEEDARRREFKDKLVRALLANTEAAMSALSASSVERFLKLMFIVAESGARILGIEYVMWIFESRTLWERIEQVLKLGKSDFSSLSELLPQIEAAMEQMMLASMYFETDVTKSAAASLQDAGVAGGSALFLSSSDPRAAVIARLQRVREGALQAGYPPTRFLPVPEGYWPAGLRSFNRSSLVSSAQEAP